MVPSLPLLFYESSVSVKENPDRKKIYIYIYILSKYILRLSSSRSYRITFVFCDVFLFFFYIFTIYLHFIKFFTRNFCIYFITLKKYSTVHLTTQVKNIIDHFQKYFPSVTLIISIRIDLS